MKYSEILKETRTKNNYTQNDIAIKLGINRSTYKDYELQNSIIPIKHLIALSNLYNISIDYMLGLTNLENYSQNSNSINKEQAGKRFSKRK